MILILNNSCKTLKEMGMGNSKRLITILCPLIAFLCVSVGIGHETKACMQKALAMLMLLSVQLQESLVLSHYLELHCVLK